MAIIDVNTSADVFNPARERAGEHSILLVSRVILALRIAVWHQRRLAVDPQSPKLRARAQHAWALLGRASEAVLKLRDTVDDIAFGMVAILDAAVELRETDVGPRYIAQTVEHLPEIARRLDDREETRMQAMIRTMMFEIVRLADLWPTTPVAVGAHDPDMPPHDPEAALPAVHDPVPFTAIA